MDKKSVHALCRVLRTRHCVLRPTTLHPCRKTAQAHPSSTPTVKIAHFIDDTLGDDFTGLKPQYAPSDGWLSQQVCDQSDSCTSSPSFIDPSQVSNGTWHQAAPGPDTDERVVSVSFTGVSVSVFVVLLPSPTPAITEETEVGFIIDSSPTSTVNWVYNIAKLQGAAPVYNHQLWSAPLANGSHTLQIKTSGVTNSLFLFDYIQYVSSERESSSSTPSTGSPLRLWAELSEEFYYSQ
ncbi:hypothetical protein C8Q79DRAFT_735331 [Trametes meyenii]|nr:hypothetical protein C8Q79DRAFT_735331 [Trametes meyenii]